jgi:hypothetical protein
MDESNRGIAGAAASSSCCKIALATGIAVMLWAGIAFLDGAFSGFSASTLRLHGSQEEKALHPSRVAPTVRPSDATYHNISESDYVKPSEAAVISPFPITANESAQARRTSKYLLIRGIWYGRFSNQLIAFVEELVLARLSNRTLIIFNFGTCGSSEQLSSLFELAAETGGIRSVVGVELREGQSASVKQWCLQGASDPPLMYIKLKGPTDDDILEPRTDFEEMGIRWHSISDGYGSVV